MDQDACYISLLEEHPYQLLIHHLGPSTHVIHDFMSLERFATIEAADESREAARAIKLEHRLVYELQAWSRHVTRDDLRQFDGL